MEPDPSCVRAGFRNRLYEGIDNTAEASSRRQSGALAGRRALLPPHSTRSSSPPNRPTPGWSATLPLQDWGRVARNPAIEIAVGVAQADLSALSAPSKSRRNSRTQLRVLCVDVARPAVPEEQKRGI